MRARRILIAAAALAVAAAALAAATPAAEQNAYVQHNLVSDGSAPADHTDANLVNAWGLTSLPGSPWWVADNGTDVSTLYNADGTPRSLVVSVPNAPTGAVSNTGSNFVVGSGPALFLFATEEGKLLGWNMSVGTTAHVVVDNSGEDAIFKGLAIAGDRLYATDFHNGKVDVFDGNFGDGQITAFERQSNGRFEARGQLRTESGGVLTIDGLWALQFGKGAANNGPTDTLFFTAGPDDEMHGLFGTIRAAG